MAPHIPMYLRPSVLMRIGLSDYRAVGLSGCRTIGPSEYKAVTQFCVEDRAVRLPSSSVALFFKDGSIISKVPFPQNKNMFLYLEYFNQTTFVKTRKFRTCSYCCHYHMM